MTIQPAITNLPAIPDLDAPVMQDGLSQGEYERFRDALPNWRDRLICMVLRNTGLRINEVLSLTVRQCNLHGPVSLIYVQRSKKRTVEVPFEPIYLNAGLGVQLRDWIQAHNLAQTDRVFNIKIRGLRHNFTNAGMVALGRPVTPKEFRSFFVRTMVDVLSVPMAAASKMVGHADIRTTQKHYYELDAERRQAIGEGIPV